MRSVIESGIRSRRDIFVTSLDHSAAKAGMTYCKLFANENKLFHDHVLPLTTLKTELNSSTDITRIVLIDDFAGTGNTLINGLHKELEFIREVGSRGIEFVLVVLVGFASAREEIERFIDRHELLIRVYFCDDLGPQDQVFSEHSRIYPDHADRKRAREIAHLKGMFLEKNSPLGYGNSDASVIFYSSCPNNTLPILWSQNAEWRPMFPSTSYKITIFACPLWPLVALTPSPSPAKMRERRTCRVVHCYGDRRCS